MERRRISAPFSLYEYIQYRRLVETELDERAELDRVVSLLSERGRELSLLQDFSDQDVEIVVPEEFPF